MDQNVQQHCGTHNQQVIDSLCVKETCCKQQLKCPQCDQKNCKLIRLTTLNKRFKQFKDDILKIIQQIDIYNQHIITSLQQNKFDLIHQDIVNTQNIISVLQEHMNIINTRSVIVQQEQTQQQQEQKQQQQQQKDEIKYESNLFCRVLGHENSKITSINLIRQPGHPELLCNMCNQNFQIAKDFTSIKQICEHFINLKVIKEIQILQLQQYDQYLKKFRQLANLVEEQTMYNYIKDKLTYFDNRQLNLKEMIDDKFIEFLRTKLNQTDINTQKKLQNIKQRLELNNIDKLDINNMDKQILYNFQVDQEFKIELHAEHDLDEQIFDGPKLTSNSNYIQFITIHDYQSQLLLNYAQINFMNNNNETIESFTVFTSGELKYNNIQLNEKFTQEFDKQKNSFQINFYLFLSKGMGKYILLSYQGQMILKKLQNTKDLKHLQVQVYLSGMNSHGRIITQQF